MTKNNLPRCLGWLLQQDHSFGTQKLDHIIPVDCSITEPEVPIPLPLPQPDDESQRPSQDMARLQFPPQSASKPRLLTQTLSGKAQRTSASTSKTHERSPSKHRSKKETCTPTPTLTTTVKTPATNYDDSVFDIDDLDDLDDIFEEADEHVTTSSFGDFGEPTKLWNEGAATRVEPSQGRVKKRKSDDFFEDVKSPRIGKVYISPGHSGKRRQVSSASTAIRSPAKASRRERSPIPSAVQVAMTDNLDFEDFEEDEPIMETKEREPALDVPPFEHEQLPQSRPSSPESISRSLSGRSVPPEGRNERLTGVRHAIPDSDEEYEMQIGSTSMTPLLKKDGNEPRSRSLDKKELFRVSHHASSSTYSPQRTAVRSSALAAQRASGLHSSASDYKLSSSATRRHVVDSIPSPSLTPRGSSPNTKALALSKEQKSVVERFVAVPEAQCDSLLQRLEVSKRNTAEKITDCLCQDDDAMAEELTSTMQTIKLRVNALKELTGKRRAFQAMASDRSSLKLKMHELLIDQDTDVSQLEGPLTDVRNQLRESSTRIGELEKILYDLIQQAGWPSEPASPRKDEPYPSSPLPSTTRNVLVASTQQVSHFQYDPPQSGNAIEVPRDQLLRPLPRSMGNDLQNQSGRTDARQVQNSQPMRSDISRFRYQSHEPGNVSRLENSAQKRDTTYSRTMGSPASGLSPPEDYDDFEDDEDMLDAAQAFEDSYSKTAPPPSLSTARHPLAETSHNVQRKPARSPAKGDLDQTLLRHAWSKDVIHALRKRFHLQGFRHNQLEAINATLAGKDAFILMPTGGGKSLCYQLPAILQSGQTRGVTIVISPLLSLMQDQVDHLQKLKIQAFMINSECTTEHKNLVYQGLTGPRVEDFIQLLYVTPEMINKSQKIQRIFENLHRNGKLARIVIDEAHCVSQWGHDFRPDYKAVGEFRSHYPGVPVMALTATATENVKVDVMHNLGMQGSPVFTQSFNRPNLSYEIRPKMKGQMLKNLADTINTSHPGQSGIIYCLSRKSCEQVALKLSEQHGISAAHYHAGMSAEEKTRVQKDWQKGRTHVIVATIAFGMGIDKPDVRYVIHHSIPKSLEGYYQETGRAGRDGQPSRCYLYYGYGDTTSHKRMIDGGEGSYEQKERQRQMLRNVVQYCENKSDCRRVQVLAYFNEHFDSQDCNNTCDNCQSDFVFETRDFTQHAQNIVRLVDRLEGAKYTMLHCVDVYRGATNRKIKDAGHDGFAEYGRGRDLDRGDVERLFSRLIIEGALELFNQVNTAGFATQYIKLGPEHRAFKAGETQFFFQVRLSSARKPSGKSGDDFGARKRKNGKHDADAEDDTFPTSTIISSPVEARSRRKPGARNVQRTIIDSDDDDDLTHFEDVRQIGRKVINHKHQVGPPITLDQKLDELDQVHRHILGDFVDQARKSLRTTVMTKSLRQNPISDTVLREIGIAMPMTKDDLQRIEGMNEDKISHYGAMLLNLSRSARQNYEAIIAANDDHAPPTEQHQVVEISDDEFGDDVFTGAENDEEQEGVESSRYFSAASDVQHFNRQMSQINALAPTAKAKPSTKASTWGGSLGSGSGRRGRANTKGSGNRSSTGSTATRKRRTANSRGSAQSQNHSRASGVKGKAVRNSGGSTSNVNFIGMMPT